MADDEVCEIRGIGPVPLEVARPMAADSILRILVTKGGQPMAVSPGVRTIPRALRMLLEVRDRTCIVDGCDVTKGLQVDHRKDFALLGPTDLENCGLLCPLCRIPHKLHYADRRIRAAEASHRPAAGVSVEASAASGSQLVLIGGAGAGAGAGPGP